VLERYSTGCRAGDALLYLRSRQAGEESLWPHALLLLAHSHLLLLLQTLTPFASLGVRIPSLSMPKPAGYPVFGGAFATSLLYHLVAAWPSSRV
jgi:hypothetical protein